MGLLQAAGDRARFYPSEPRWRALACLKILSSPGERQNGWPLAEQPNDRMVPFFDEQGIRLQRVLTDRGAEYCGKPENHTCQLYLAVEDLYRCHDQGQPSPDQRHLRTVPQDPA